MKPKNWLWWEIKDAASRDVLVWRGAGVSGVGDFAASALLMRWSRSNKAELADKIRHFVALGMDSSQIAQRLGKTRRRVQQVAKLFSLQLKRSSG